MGQGQPPDPKGPESAADPDQRFRGLQGRDLGTVASVWAPTLKDL